MPVLLPIRSRASGWLSRWGGVLPLFVAELIVWLGFGALLPIMPLYFRDHGVDIQLLGVVIAAWPAARLIGEPIFGWIADRTPRVPLMVAGLVISAIALGLPLVFTSPLAFLILRAVAGLATAMYDPAARGYLADSTPRDRRGEAFGLYGAAQMGGLLLGPAVGALGAGFFGGIGFVFVFGAVATLVAAVAVAVRVREDAQVERHHPAPWLDLTIHGPEPPSVAQRAADDALGTGRKDGPGSLLNRWLMAAIVLNLGAYIAGGTYEVIWSLFLESKGAGLHFIGLTFAMFALPVLLFSPIAGRLIDRRGGYAFVVVGGLATATTSFLYTVVGDVLLVLPILIVEATGFAIAMPALYAMVAAGSPPGRSSTAQGLFGAAGTLGTIVAAVAAGYLASFDIRYPFWAGGTAMFIALAIGLAIGGRTIRQRASGTRAVPSAEGLRSATGTGSTPS
ncbi:MAG TPA: MFS transporter [Vitreimonas sp.]|nr:MFS transporter [Vitreimonas sp.]